MCCGRSRGRGQQVDEGHASPRDVDMEWDDEGCSCCRWCREEDWSWLWQYVGILFLGAAFAVAGGVVDRFTDDILFGTFRLYRLLYLAAVGVAMYIPCMVLNRLVFTAVSLCMCTRGLRSVAFYVMSFDGPLAIVLMFSLTWVASRVVLDTSAERVSSTNLEWMDRTFGSLVVLAVFYAIRCLLLKITLSSVLHEAYENRLLRLMAVQELAKILTHPHPQPMPTAPRTPRMSEVIRTEHESDAHHEGGPPELPNQMLRDAGRDRNVFGIQLGEGGVPSSWNSVSEFHATLRRMERGSLKMYDERGELHSMRRSDRVRSVARAAFKRLVRAVRELDDANSAVTLVTPPHSAPERPQEDVPAARDPQARPASSTEPVAAATATAATRATQIQSPPRPGEASATSTSSPVPPPLRLGGRARSFSGRVGSPALGPAAASHAQVVPISGDVGPTVVVPGKEGETKGGIRRVRSGSQLDRTAQERRQETKTDTNGEAGGKEGKNGKTAARLRWDRPLAWAWNLFAGDSHSDAQQTDATLFLTRKQFERFLGDDERLKDLYIMFDSNEDGFVSQTEFESGLAAGFEEWKGFRASLAGQGYVTRAVKALADMVYVFVGLIVVLLILRVSIASLFLPIGSILLSMSFAFGGVLSNIVSSFVFVVFTRAYDVGDRISSPELLGGLTLVVSSVDVLTTTLDRINGKRVIVPNHVLATLALENHRRAKKTACDMLLTVGRNTTAAQLSALKDKIKGYLAAHPQDWKPSPWFIVSDELATNQGLLQVMLWTQCRHRWQDGGKVWSARGALVFFVVTAMRELGIEHYQPRQRVSIAWEDHEGHHPEDYAAPTMDDHATGLRQRAVASRPGLH